MTSSDEPYQLSRAERLAILADQEQLVRREMYQLDVSLRVQRRIKAEPEVIVDLTKRMEKYEMILDELQVIRDGVKAVPQEQTP